MKYDPQVAFLIFDPLKAKRKNNSFDGNGNVGASVVKELLENDGLQVGFCTPQTAKNFKIILVSMTSSYDIISFYKNVSPLAHWKRVNRKFKVVCGGFGMQNPVSIRNYIDYAIFGRGEGVVEPLVKALLDGKTYEHKSIMALPDIAPVWINQPEKLLSMKCYSETFSGCPHKCLFCHFTWARVRIGDESAYVQTDLTGGSPELTWKQMLKWEQKIGRARSAIDGFSERMRYSFGKRISDEEIVEGINHRGSFEGNTVLTVYNIGNMPLEDRNDRDHLELVLKKANPKNRVVVVLHTTPFRPSPATPMQWASAKLSPSYHHIGGKFFCDRPNLQLCHSRGNESAYSHLMTLVVERATEKSDKLFHAIATNSKLNSMKVMDSIKAIENNFDLTQYLREYELGEEPTWFLNSYIDKKSMRKAYETGMRKAKESN
jgi:radical SAM superfamily enzyme YgiQ (UPF0313 family)